MNDDGIGSCLFCSLHQKYASGYTRDASGFGAKSTNTKVSEEARIPCATSDNNILQHATKEVDVSLVSPQFDTTILTQVQ